VDLHGGLADGHAVVGELDFGVIWTGAGSGGLSDDGDGQRIDEGFELRGIECGSLGVGVQAKVEGEASGSQAAGGDKLSARDQRGISKGKG
jgi:hypothetical protein